MLSKIIAFSIRNKLIVGLMVIALTAYGVYNLTKLPIDAVPDITNNQVLVMTPSPSLGAADIERLITFPIEQATRSIPGIIEQRSFSRFGLSLVTIVFNDETDVYWARQQISEKMVQLQDQIPPELGTPTLGPVTTGLGEIFQYVVRPKPGYEARYTPLELRTIQDWIVRRQLLGTPGVADVSSFGGKLKQYEISVNYDRLQAYNLTIGDVFTALESNNQNTGGAYIEKGPTVLYIRTEGLIQTEDDIASITIKRLGDGTPVSVGDVATVQIGHAIRYGAVSYNDKGEVAGAVVMMLKGENSNQVIKDVKEKITQIEKTLPEGVMIEAFLDRTKMVNNAIGTVEKNLAEGALIVVFILVIFLGNMRAGLLVASVIPLSMLFAVIMMNIFGVSGNLMSLGALDFGLIIDGAVIIVEAVMHRLHSNKTFQGLAGISQKQMDDEVEYSAGKMMNAAVFGQIIILIVYLPILSLEGIEGKMFKPMAQTVAFAILGAFLLSLTYVPMMSALVLSKKIRHKPTFSDKMMTRLERWYKRALVKALVIPRLLVGAAFSLFVVAVVLLMNMGGEFIPKLEEGDFAIDTRVLTGSSLTTTINSTQQGAKVLLQKFPEVEKVVTKIGSGEIPTDPMPMEASDLMVILKPKDEWTSAETFDELAEKMSKALAAVPGITTGFQFPVQMRFNELMTGGRQDVVVKIFGENLDTLARHAERMGQMVNSVDGARDVYVEAITGLPQIVVEYNRAALRQFGLSITDVNNTLQAAFAGAVSGQVFENERRFDLVVRLEGDLRKGIDDVRNLQLQTASGMQIPLQQVAAVDIKVGPNQIQRENAQRRISVGFNVRGRDVESIVNELQQKIDRELKLPAGYYVTYGGQFENLLAAKKRLGIAVPVALLLIFLMLYFAFGSIKQGLLVYSAIPLSAIGGVFALLLRDMPFSISAGIGFIALFGVAVLNGIVLITEFNHLKQTGLHDIRERIFHGTQTRLRPVLMTASVASLGFLPMALSNGAGAEVQRPLATVVIGGLITATLLTLFVLPVLYRWSETNSQLSLLKKNKMKKSFTAVKAWLPLLFVLLAAANGKAQAPITLQAALDTALSRNYSLQAAQLRTLAAQKAEGTAVDLPATNGTFEYGNFNSAYADTRLGISQSFSFPVVYRRQRQLLQAQTNALKLDEAAIRWQLRKEVTALYYQVLLLRERRSLLLRSDSLFQSFLERQDRRFAVGDINVLEKTTAETQRMQIAAQLQWLEADLETAQTQFSILVNTGTVLTPVGDSAKAILTVLPDVSLLVNHPSLRALKQEQEVAGRNIAVQKSGLLPQVSIGYFNQSLRGVQNIDGVEKFFGGGSRFSSVQAGVNIPLFRQAQKARIAASEIQYEATGADYKEAYRRQKTVLESLLLQYGKAQGQVRYYEEHALRQARLLREQASLKLGSGDISHLEWILLVNQAIQLEADYFSTLQTWNETVIELAAYSNY
ncbi:CusA/CzcA family heavy metal efflux RND transporter [Flavisolibacter sp. BT320]|nr:CusA/CzcA family heavy metal efflux RND transporter [Flavisolibacter longurius]